MNQATVGSPASTTRFYLSVDAVRNGGDTLLTGKRAVSTLGPGATSSGSSLVTVAAGTAPGTYRILACADDQKKIAETNEVNNCLVAAGSVVIALPDLVTTSVSDPPTSAILGGKFTFMETVANQGTGPAAGSTTRFYLSADELRNAGDTPLSGNRTVGPLEPGAFSPGSKMLTVPLSSLPGTYYVVACADDLVKVGESNEVNNCKASANKIAILAGPSLTSQFTWPVDPSNVSNGFDGACADWPGHSEGCFWISTGGWRDAQPFQRHLFAHHGYHLGADFNLGSGADDARLEVYAVADGTVSSVRESVPDWGNIVFVRHVTPWGTYTSMYAHVDWAESGIPAVGKAVSKGDPIALIGTGGGLYPYHLHFEIRAADDTRPGPGYTSSVVIAGPQSQIDPNSFIAGHR